MSELEETKEIVEKPGWAAFWVYALLVVISVFSLYPSLVEQAQVSISVYELEDVSASMLGFLNMIQPIVISMIALVVGHFFAYKVRLRSVIYEKINDKKSIGEDVRKALPLALILGAITGLVAMGFDVVFRPYLPEILQASVPMPRFLSTLSSILYGGITEEIMLRWGFMSIVAYVLSLKGEFLNKWIYIGSIALSAVVFALGHYPISAEYFTMTPIIWIRMFALNGLGGAFFGWLYWKHHLEAAMLSHMFAHVTMAAVAIIFASLGV